MKVNKMAIDNLLKIAEDKEQLKKLKSLIERKHALALAQEVQKQELSDINNDAKLLGIKAGELTQIVKFVYDGELLDWHLALGDYVNDHLIDK